MTSLKFVLFLALDFKNENTVYEGKCKKGKVDLMLTTSDDDFVAMATGKLNGQKVNNKNLVSDARFECGVQCFCRRS